MMNYPSIFNDVLGPVMRGPSSSHCAASLRIGLGMNKYALWVTMGVLVHVAQPIGYEDWLLIPYFVFASMLCGIGYWKCRLRNDTTGQSSTQKGRPSTSNKVKDYIGESVISKRVQ